MSPSSPKPTTQTTTTFPSFPVLPQELQTLIWQHAIIPRIITISPSPAPALFSTSRLSRATARPQYSCITYQGPYVSLPSLKARRARRQVFKIFINYDLDYLYLTPERVLSFYRSNRVVRWLLGPPRRWAFGMKNTYATGTLVSRSRRSQTRIPDAREAEAEAEAEMEMERTNPALKTLLQNIRAILMDLEDTHDEEPELQLGRGPQVEVDDFCWQAFWATYLVHLPKVEKIALLPDSIAISQLRSAQRRNARKGKSGRETGLRWEDFKFCIVSSHVDATREENEIESERQIETEGVNRYVRLVVDSLERAWCNDFFAERLWGENKKRLVRWEVLELREPEPLVEVGKGKEKEGKRQRILAELRELVR